MASPLDKPTWVLLPPSELPPASRVPFYLASIASDFERPHAGYLPEKFAEKQELLSATAETWSTVDTSFASVLYDNRHREIYVHLSQVFSEVFDSRVQNIQVRKASRVATYILEHQDTIFDLIQKKYQKEIVKRLKAPHNKSRSLYMVVGIKTCFRADQCFVNAPQNVVSGSVAVPAALAANVNEADGAGGRPIADFGGEFSSLGAQAFQARAEGERIFAVQYRLVKMASEWKSILARQPPKSRIDTLLTLPRGKGMMSGEVGKDKGEDSFSTTSRPSDQVPSADELFLCPVGQGLDDDVDPERGSRIAVLYE
jgi:hypothetical protein